MRTFRDAQGTQWQAALLDGSFGGVILIFGQLSGSALLHRPLDGMAENLNAAEQLLASLDDAGLRGLLAEASPWSVGG